MFHRPVGLAPLSPAASWCHLFFSAIFRLKLSPSSCNVPYPNGLVGSEAGPAKPMRTLAMLTSWKYTLFNIENLVLRARSVLNGFAGKDCELFWSTGAMEYWSVGKSERPNFNLNEFFHYSITPQLHYSRRLPHEGKTSRTSSGAGPKPGPLGPDFLL